MCVCFQSAVKWVIPPPDLRTESNDVEWKRFIEALNPPLTPPLSLSLYLSVSCSISSSLLSSSSMFPSLCFYGGIIMSLSHPLLFRLERNNKFQNHADAVFSPSKTHSVDSTETLHRNNTRQQRLQHILLFFSFFYIYKIFLKEKLYHY